MARSPDEAAFVEAGDQALVVRFGERPSPEARRRVWALVEALGAARVPGLLHWQPSSSAVLLRFDPLATGAERLAAAVGELLKVEPSPPLVEPRLVEIPVAYGGEQGPDLEAVASHCGLDPAEVVARHSGASYLVDYFGFVAGFAYLSGLPPELATPRLPEPRRRVPPGSVAIGGTQTAIYPAPTPGGWRLIGRTPLRPARFGDLPSTLFSPGDRLRFVPIAAAEFARRSQWR